MVNASPLTIEMSWREEQLRNSAIESLAAAIQRVVADDPDEAIFQVASLNWAAWAMARSATIGSKFLDRTVANA